MLGLGNVESAESLDGGSAGGAEVGWVWGGMGGGEGSEMFSAVHAEGEAATGPADHGAFLGAADDAETGRDVGGCRGARSTVVE